MGFLRSLFGGSARSTNDSSTRFAKAFSERAARLLPEVQRASPELAPVSASAWLSATAAAALHAAPLLLIRHRPRLALDWPAMVPSIQTALRPLGASFPEARGTRDAELAAVANRIEGGDASGADTALHSLIGSWVLTEALRVPALPAGLLAVAAPLGKALARDIVAAADDAGL